MAEGAFKLSEEELHQCLTSLNVPCRLSDIKTPTKEFVIRVFECLLKDLQIDITHHNLRTFGATKHIEYPAIIEEGQSLTLLIMFINMITSPFGLDLYARDVIFPKPKRTKKILNYLIVFWKYVLMKYDNFQGIAEKFQMEKIEAEKLCEENDRLLERYNECLSILKNELPSKEKLISCNASKVEKCKEMEKQREVLIEENSALKKKENYLQTAITSTDVSIVTTKAQIKELEELILSSPEKKSTEIIRLKDLIREEETKIREKETELKDRKKNLDTLEQALEKSSKDLEEVKNIHESLQKFEDLGKGFILDFQKCQEGQENLKKLESELLMKEELQSINKHKSAKTHLKIKKQLDSFNETSQILQQSLAQEQRDLICMKTTQAELVQKMDKDVESILAVVEKCKDAEKTSKRLIADYKSQLDSIVQTFHSDCGEVKNYVMKKYMK